MSESVSRARAALEVRLVDSPTLRHLDRKRHGALARDHGRPRVSWHDLVGEAGFAEERSACALGHGAVVQS